MQQSGAKSHVKGSLWGHHSSIVVRLSSLLYHSWPTRGTNEKNQSHTFGEAIHQRQQDPANTFTYWDVPHIVRTCAALTIAAPWTPGLNSTYLAFLFEFTKRANTCRLSRKAKPSKCHFLKNRTFCKRCGVFHRRTLAENKKVFCCHLTVKRDRLYPRSLWAFQLSYMKFSNSTLDFLLMMH